MLNKNKEETEHFFFQDFFLFLFLFLQFSTALIRQVKFYTKTSYNSFNLILHYALEEKQENISAAI